MVTLPIEIMRCILHYIHPFKLNIMANSVAYIRYIVNRLDRIKYIERHKYSVTGSISDLYTNEQNIDALINRWYFHAIYCDIRDESALKIIKRLKNKKINLVVCENISISNLLVLYRVGRLELWCQKTLFDVSMFKNLHMFKLYECHNVTDISMLGNIRHLELYRCFGISNLFGLDTVYNLTISYCDHITDISPVNGVHKLQIEHCNGITDISMLDNVYNIRLYNCDSIRKIGNINKPNLYANSCHNIYYDRLNKKYIVN